MISSLEETLDPTNQGKKKTKPFPWAYEHDELELSLTQFLETTPKAYTTKPKPTSSQLKKWGGIFKRPKNWVPGEFEGQSPLPWTTTHRTLPTLGVDSMSIKVLPSNKKNEKPCRLLEPDFLWSNWISFCTQKSWQRKTQSWGEGKFQKRPTNFPQNPTCGSFWINLQPEGLKFTIFPVLLRSKNRQKKRRFFSVWVTPKKKHRKYWPLGNKKGVEPKNPRGRVNGLEGGVLGHLSKGEKVCFPRV